MEYKIVKVCGCPETDNLEMELEDEVNMYIGDGWRPFGSVCIVNVGTPKGYKSNFVEVWQPMIKDKKGD